MSFFRSVLPSRRDVLKQSGMLTALSATTSLTALLSAPANAAAGSPEADGPTTRKGIDGDNLFTKIGVRPLLNAAELTQSSPVRVPCLRLNRL